MSRDVMQKSLKVYKEKYQVGEILVLEDTYSSVISNGLNAVFCR